MSQTATVNVVMDEDVKRDVEMLKIKRKHIPLKERLRDYDFDNGYKTVEWDTGEPVGNEVF